MTQFTYSSLVGHREHILSGKATSQRNRILACLFESAVPLCRRQIMKLTGIEINAVCGRVNTLIKSELLRVAYEAVDPATGRLPQRTLTTPPPRPAKSFRG